MGCRRRIFANGWGSARWFNQARVSWSSALTALSAKPCPPNWDGAATMRYEQPAVFKVRLKGIWCFLTWPLQNSRRFHRPT